MKITKLLIVIVLSFSAHFVCGQIQEGNSKQVQDSTWIAQQEYINGVYIPIDEEESYAEVKTLAQGKGLEMFQSAQEDSIRRKLHFGLGGWMMKNWRLDRGSRLSYYLRKRGLLHPDDMVEYLIVSLHRNLNQQEQQYDELIEEFRLKRLSIAEKEKQRKLEKGILLKELSESEIKKKPE